MQLSPEEENVLSCHDGQKSSQLFCAQVVVQHVNIQGLGRTKEDLLGYEISDVFSAKNLIDVCLTNSAECGIYWAFSDVWVLHIRALFFSFSQVMKKAHIARQRLLRLGIFKDVEVLIDTSEGNLVWLCLYGFILLDVTSNVRVGSPSSGADALPNGLDVIFEVTEVKRLAGSYNTMVGNNEGSMVRESPFALMIGFFLMRFEHEENLYLHPFSSHTS